MITSYILEIAGIFFIPVIVVIISLYIGELYGTNHIKKSPDLPQNAVGTVVGSVFGLLAFILAFTFQIASNHYDARKELLLDEASCIRTTFLQSRLLQDPIRSDTRKLLSEYVDLRIELSNDPSKLSRVLVRSQQILDKLWYYAETMPEKDRSSEEFAQYTSSVTSLVDSYNRRITVALAYRIPIAVLSVLYIISILSMLALGYQFGISGKGSFKINLLLAIIFSMVIFLILALDRPETRVAGISQKPMIMLQNQIHGK
jgi:hypothetical protein